PSRSAAQHQDLHSFPTRRSSDLKKVKETQAEINWQVIEDNTEATFTIERSSNAKSFEAIGTLKANTSDVRQKADYSFTDNNPIKDRKSTRLNSSHVKISYAVFCL